MENRLLDNFNDVIISQWMNEEVNESYNSLSSKELFEVSYHIANIFL